MKLNEITKKTFSGLKLDQWLKNARSILRNQKADENLLTPPEGVRFCKDCGTELASTHQFDLCANCREKQGSTLKKLAGVVVGIFSVVLLIVRKR